MGLFGGMAVPFILRWYWERFNGWGYAVGTLVGVTTALVQKLIWPGLSEAYQLVIIASLSLVSGVAATYLTAATEESVLKKFYERTRPFGWWPRAREGMSEAALAPIRAENRRDLVSVLFALGFFFFLFLSPMYFIIREWSKMTVALVVTANCGVVLYFTWYRHLRSGGDSGEEKEQV